MKYLGISLTKYVRNLYAEDYKTIMHKTKEEINRDSPCLWIRRLNTVKMLILPNSIYRDNAISVKIPKSYFVNVNKLILKFVWKVKRYRMVNAIFKENKVGELILPDFKTYY